MHNYRMTSLVRVVTATEHPLWIQSGFMARRVKSVRLGHKVDAPDLSLVTDEGIEQFEDQQIKLDLDEMRLEAKSVSGAPVTLVFGACAPS